MICVGGNLTGNILLSYQSTVHRVPPIIRSAALLRADVYELLHLLTEEPSPGHGGSNQSNEERICNAPQLLAQDYLYVYILNPICHTLYIPHRMTLEVKMITSDIGFWVDNYVGTYQIIESEGKKYIASKEFHPARNGEAELKKKRLFMDLFKNNEYILIQLANVDTKDENSIVTEVDLCK